MDDLEDALRRYREDRFTDDDITRCTGLTERAYRELIKHKTIRTVTEGRGPGRVRIGDSVTLKRTAVIAALNQAGWSLAASGQIAYFMPLHTLLFEICDPCAILLQRSADVDPKTRLPPRVVSPKFDWFDPNRLAQAEPETDWVVEVYDGRFVAVICNAMEPTIFGDLREDGARFVAWLPLRRRAVPAGRILEFAQELNPRGLDAARVWEDPSIWIKELKFLDYRYERHDKEADLLCIAAEAAIRSPLFKTTVNVTFALRKALRRYLGLEPSALPKTEE